MTIQIHPKRFLFLLTFLAAACLWAGSAQAEDQLINNNNGTIKDNFTGLTWVQNPTVMPALMGTKTYMEADKACTELVHASLGPNVWRLPAINELKSIYDGRFKNPRINTGFFSADGGAYWSRTPYLPGSKAWTLNYKTGYLGGFDKNNPDKPARQYTRCVARI